LITIFLMVVCTWQGRLMRAGAGHVLGRTLGLESQTSEFSLVSFQTHVWGNLLRFLTWETQVKIVMPTPTVLL